MLLIKNVYLYDPASGTEGARDILIQDGRFAHIAERIPEALLSAPGSEGRDGPVPVLDGTGLCAAPGFVDTHAHFRDPGFTHKEDLHTGALAAARGGYTSVILMANTRPCVDHVHVLSDILERGKKEKIHLYSCANVTKGMAGKEVVDFDALAAAGAAGFTDDGVPVLDAAILEKALRAAKRLHLPVSLHEEDKALIAQNGIHAGSAAARALGLAGSPREAEISLIRRDLDIAVRLGAPLCIQHISTAEGVELVRRARKENPRIHAEATPHHFSLTCDAILRCGPLAKVNPPLRTELDRQAIIRGLADGTIDLIATDHAPHTDEEKGLGPGRDAESAAGDPFASKDTPLPKRGRPFLAPEEAEGKMPADPGKAHAFVHAPSGMIGLETAFSLGIRHLVQPGHLSMQDLIACLTVHPADFYQLPAGRVREGAPADLVLFDPAASWTVRPPFASRSSNSPFLGQALPGVIRYTISGGNIIFAQ